MASISTPPPKDSEPDLVMDLLFQPLPNRLLSESFQVPAGLPKPPAYPSQAPEAPEPPKVEPPALSPMGSQSGSELVPSFTSPPHQGLSPLQEVVDENGAITKVCVPFSVRPLGICKERFGRFSENPGKFRDEFVRLGLMFWLTWQDVSVLVTKLE